MHNWSVRAEYRYSDFGRYTDSFASATLPAVFQALARSATCSRLAGRVVAEGTPEQVAAVEDSHTGRFLALVLAPITEELFYRGIFYRSLRDRHGVLVGAVVSAVLFGASHVVDAPWRDVVFLQTLMVFTGAGLALIYERRANLVADIAAHVAFNVIGIVIIFSTR